MNAIEIQNLTKYYGKSRGIVDLSLSVPEGEFFGFIGPNGAGKSTTIRTLLGLIRADSGKAMVFGKDITREKEAILADIGYMPSEAVFYTGMKVREIIPALFCSSSPSVCSCTCNAFYHESFIMFQIWKGFISPRIFAGYSM